MSKEDKMRGFISELMDWVQDTDDCGIELGVPGYLLMQKGRSIATRMIINYACDEK